MPESPADPLVLFSNGIPISPTDLDFGGLVSKEQINRLSSFSQMVNEVPSSTSKVWIPTGSRTWDIYELVLSQAEFADSAVADTRAVTMSMFAMKSGAGSPLASIAASVAPALEDVGFRFKAPLAAPVPKATSFAALAEPSFLATVGPPTSLATLFSKLDAQLTIDRQTDTTGAAFYPTPFFPADFYSAAYAGNWRPFEITPQPGDLWMPVGNGGKITGEMITVPLQRPWWSSWVFSNRGWRFSRASGMGQLSDGGSPAGGMMPLFCSALLIARNVQTVPGRAAAVGAVSPAPFTLNENLAPPSPVTSLSANGTPEPAAMMIFGFVCTPLPKSPNPDPSLHWPS